jgi:hypothetical protein
VAVFRPPIFLCQVSTSISGDSAISIISDSIDLSTLRITCLRCVIDSPRGEGTGDDGLESESELFGDKLV